MEPFDRVLSLVTSRTGLAFPEVLRSHAEFAIRQHLAATGLPDLVSLVQGVESGTVPLSPLVDRLAIKETYFFREPAQFDFIEFEAVPDLWRTHGAHHVIRAWSAGCATGEETYSLAILFEEAGWRDRTSLVGTDLCHEAVERAKAGEFRPWSFRGSHAARARAHCLPGGEGVLRLVDSIHTGARIFRHNLWLDPVPPPDSGTEAFDLILCRNVLLYFPEESARVVATRLAGALSEGGWLITGSTDPPLGDLPGCELVRTGMGYFYRRVARGTECVPPRVHAIGLPPTSPQDETPSWPGFEWPLPEPEAAVDEPEGVVAWQSQAAHSRAESLSEGALVSPAMLQAEPGGTAARLGALANQGRVAEAIQGAERALREQPFDAQIHLLCTILLTEQGRFPEAAEAARRTIYLDPTMAIAHFASGFIWKAIGNRKEARRAFRNAAALCAGLPEDGALPNLEHACAGELLRAARAQMSSLERSV